MILIYLKHWAKITSSLQLILSREFRAVGEDGSYFARFALVEVDKEMDSSISSRKKKSE